MTDNADPAQCAAEAAAALPRLCALQQWLAACLRLESNASSPEASDQVQRAAQHLAEAAAADRPASGGVAAAYLCLASALRLLGPSWVDFSSAEQLDHWCGAANSALHRLPHLGCMVLLGEVEAAIYAALLAQQSVVAFSTGAQAACSWVDQQVSSNEGPRSSTSAALAALAPRLRALHETACRLVHWATSGAASEEAAELQAVVPQLTDWRLLLRAVDDVFSAACAAQRCVIEQAAEEYGDLEAR